MGLCSAGQMAKVQKGDDLDVRDPEWFSEPFSSNVYTYPNPKPTPYNNEKIVIIVQCDKIMLYWCAHNQ